MKKIFFVILLILSVATYSFGADHYIDPDVGQGGDGTIGDPWNNWNEDVGASPTCGDTYYFKKGTVHRDAVYIPKTCTSGSHLKLSAYGTGDDPIITSRNKVIGVGGWSGPSGGVYTYYLGVSSIEGIWVGNTGSDTWGQEVHESYPATSTPSDGYWSSGSGYVYYNPAVGDPSPGDGATFFFEWTESASAQALSSIRLSSASYVDIENLQLMRSRFHGASVENSTYITFDNVYFGYNGTSNIYRQSAGFNSIGNGVEISGNSDHVYLTDCIAEWQYDNGLTVESANSDPPEDVTFTRCTGRYNGASGASVKAPTDAGHTAKAVFTECVFNNNGNASLIGSNHYSYSGIKFHQYSSGSVLFCKIYDNLGAGIQLTLNPLAGWTTLIQGNLIYNNATGNTTGWPGTDRGSSQDGGITINDNYGNAGESVRIYNNTIVNNTLYGVFQYSGTDVADLYLSNNIITGNTSKDVRIESDSVNVSIENNLYSESLSNYLGNDNYTSISDWNTATGGTDFSANPYLNTDYTLLSNSPARDTGKILGASYDDAILPTSSWPDSVTTGDQDDYGTGWEIGAFIYTGATSGPVISGNGPTSTQTCDGTTSTDEIYLDTDRDSTCRASRKGTHTCATAYADLDVEMTDEGGNHHTFTGSGAGEPGYQVTCGATETIVAICQDDGTSETGPCVEWSYQVNPASAGAIAQRHPVAWANIAQIHPVAVANIAQIHPIDTATEAGEVACDDCSGSLMFSWHMENNDTTPDITVHDSIDDPCGCCKAEGCDEVGAGTENPIFSGAQQSDGSYSLLISSTDDRYDFTVSSNDIINPDDVKITFDLYISSYPSSGYAEVIRTSYNADNNMTIRTTDSNTVMATHKGGGDLDELEISVATGSWVSCEYQAKQGVAGNDHYLICGATSDEDDDDLTALAASTTYLQFGDHYGTGSSTYYIDNVKIYQCDKY